MAFLTRVSKRIKASVSSNFFTRHRRILKLKFNVVQIESELNYLNDIKANANTVNLVDLLHQILSRWCCSGTEEYSVIYNSSLNSRVETLSFPG